MQLAHNIILDSYSFLILAVIGASSIRLMDRHSLQNRLFMSMVLLIMLLLPIDIFARLDGYGSAFYPALNHIGNFLLYFMNPILPSVWLLYVHYQIHQDERKTLRLVSPIWLLLIANTVALVLSQITGWYYSIDDQNIYHRGPMFYIPVLLTVLPLAFCFVYTVFNRRKLDKRSFLSLLLFPTPMALSIVVQLIDYRLSAIVNGLAISILIVFVNIQTRSIHTDHLTGIYNRKMLENYLKRKINSSSYQHTFAAILLDLDDFKAINDTYGHEIGDIALMESVQLLKQCVRTNDLVARYGGDEFIIVLDISDQHDLDSMTERVSLVFAEFNKHSSRPYRLQFSMGSAVYDVDAHQSAEEFIHHIDSMMYQDKQIKKNQKNIQVVNFDASSAMQSFRLSPRHSVKPHKR